MCWTTSDESKSIVSKAQIGHGYRMMGDQNPNWKGGIVPLGKLRLLRMAWRKLSKKVLENYNYQCVVCGSNKNLHVHHLIPFRTGGQDIEENLTVVCAFCHPRIENKGANYDQ